ncbi:MAG: DDE-type integrase/transposase/recombinase [Peptococcaceae bacterium]|jgi:transposase InsO family protein|nr:DDE-type integrase/transposase/recombinase [Peptococcaceae bacterium]
MERENKIQTSTMRFEMIAPLLADGLCAAEKRRIRLEILDKHGISERTLRRYLESYRKDGLNGLEPAGRAEAGTFKAIPADILEIAMQCKRELPERSVRNIVTILEKEGHVKPGMVSRSTLSHNLLALGHSTKQLRYETGTQAARRFVRKGRNTLWQSDVKFGPYVPDDKGKTRRTYLASFIDDCTRVVTHSEFYFNHRVPILEDCFRKAMLKFGKPDSIYVDNGAEFVSRWMRIGCARLGIQHLRTKPYSAPSKGKVERFQLTVEEFLRESELAKIKDLSHLNSLYRAWLDEGYQHEEHEGIGKISPMQAFQKDEKRIRFATPEECYDAFLHEETRTVDKAGCFSLGGITFEVGTAFIRKKVDVRFDPFDLSIVEVWHAGAKQLDAKPIVVGEFAATPPTEKTAVDIGRSRLLDIYAKENEKRRRNAVGILRFGPDGGDHDV